jgi:hypothetical protein
MTGRGIDERSFHATNPRGWGAAQVRSVGMRYTECPENGQLGCTNARHDACHVPANSG